MNRIGFGLRLFYWFSLRQIIRHRLRVLMVLLGIALGAAVFTSVRLAVRASLDAFSSGVAILAGDADGVVTRPGGRVAEKTMAILGRQPAIGAMAPFSKAYVREERPDSDVFLMVGIDPLLDRSFRSWQALAYAAQESAPWTDLMLQPYSMMVSLELARDHNWAAGDRVTLVHARGRQFFTILGVLDTQGLALADGGRLAIADIATFQEFSGTGGLLDRIDLKTRFPETPLDGESLKNQLPPGVAVSTASASGERGWSMIQAYQLNLTVLSLAALFVGMFLVYSLVALNVAARRKEIAILRALGASQGHIFLLFITEGGLMGLLGWLLAIPISGVLIPVLLHGVSRTINSLFLRVAVTGAELDPGELGISLLVTVGIALLAALHPARSATAVAPVEAMRVHRWRPGKTRSPGGLALMGSTVILAVWPLSRLPGMDGVPLPGYLCMLLLFTGFSLLAPWAIRLLGRVMGGFLFSVGAAPAFLAGRYVRNTGPGTAISIGALITAVALYSALVIMIHSFRGTVDLWVHQSIVGDLFLTTRNAEANQIWEPFTSGEMAALAELGAEAHLSLVPSRRFALSTPRTAYYLDFWDLKTFQKVGGRFLWMDGNPREAMPRLIAGRGVIVSEVYANRTGQKPGDTFRAEVDGVALEIPILGVVRDYRTRGGVVFASLTGLGARFGGLPWSAVRFFLEPLPGDGSPADRGTAVTGLKSKIVRRLGDRFDMISGESLRSEVLRIFDETFAVTGLLLVIALAVAALGITTTMTVLVLQRIRQINTIRALGGSSGQVRRMILWETVLIVFAGEIAGLVCGILLSHILVYVINRQSFGWTFIYGVNWGALALSLPLILATALAAALPAVGLAFRQAPANLLRER